MNYNTKKILFQIYSIYILYMLDYFYLYQKYKQKYIQSKYGGSDTPKKDQDIISWLQQLQLTNQDVYQVLGTSFDQNNQNIVYRALRPNELYNILEKKAILPPCHPCPGQDPCCQITPGAHVSAGSKAKTKSAWISTTKSLEIASLWAARNPPYIFTSLDPRQQQRPSGIVIAINIQGLQPLDPTTITDIGETGRNAAKASQELLFYGSIPSHHIVGYYNACKTTNSKLQLLQPPNISVMGKKKKKSSTLFVMVVPLSYQDLIQSQFKQDKQFSGETNHTH